MQIWRTTRSAPGRSRMKARLVRLWCFVLTMRPQKSLASSSIWSVLFRPPYAFLFSWMPPEGSEIFHSRESVFFFSYPVRVRGENRRRKEVHDHRRNCLSLLVTFSGWKILENGWAVAFSSKSLLFGSMLSLVSTKVQLKFIRLVITL